MSKLVFVFLFCAPEFVRSDDSSVAPFFFDNSSSPVVSVHEGSTAVLECYAGGNPAPRVYWHDALGAVLTTLEYRHEGNVYQINKTRREAMLNRYQCVADNGIGEKALRNVTLNVNFSPFAQVNKPELYEAVDYDVHFYCMVEAYPLPTVVWTKSGEPLTEDASITLSQSFSSKNYVIVTLDIKKVQDRHFGEYECKGVNEFGTARDLIKLKKAEKHECPPVCKDPPVILNSTVS